MKNKLYAVLLTLLLIGLVSSAVMAQTGIGWFYVEDDLWVKDDVRVRGTMTVDTGIEVDDITMTDDLTVGDDLTVSDDATITDDLTIGGDLTATAGTTQTIGYQGTITPLTPYHRITATAARGTSSITAGSAGDIVVIENVGSQTITLTDTGTLLLSGNAALGQYDSIILLADAAGNWVQIAPEGDN